MKSIPPFFAFIVFGAAVAYAQFPPEYFMTPDAENQFGMVPPQAVDQRLRSLEQRLVALETQLKSTGTTNGLGTNSANRAPDGLSKQDAPGETPSPTTRQDQQNLGSENTNALAETGRTWTTVQVWLCILLIVFGTAVSWMVKEAVINTSQSWSPTLVIRAFGLVLVITGALLLVAAGRSAEQISPAMGLLGAVAGYLLGSGGAYRRKEKPVTHDEKNSAKEPPDKVAPEKKT